MEDKLHRIAGAPVCVFDDPGREKVSEWMKTQYYRIIDKRRRDRLPTVFTSNHGWDDIAKLLGDAVSSRFYALTPGRHVFGAAPDRRVLSVPGATEGRIG
jgi:DNA replication protein DnaC